ncbi:HrpB_2, partial [Pseudomonas syringae pv. actinidiae ICMP 19079]
RGMGVQVHVESPPKTRIEVVTEGILTRRLQDDPALEGVGLLIFDEFHVLPIARKTSITCQKLRSLPSQSLG